MFNACFTRETHSWHKNFNLLHVQGDKVSGKSSFINLLLSKDILPTKQLACTATICELKHSNKGETNFAILYTKDDTTRIDLNEDEKQQFKTLKSHIQELIEDESPFLKIEIFWPFEILKVWKVIAIMTYHCRISVCLILEFTANVVI